MPLRILPAMMLFLLVFFPLLNVYAGDFEGMLWKGTVTFNYSHLPKPKNVNVSDDKKTIMNRTSIRNTFTAKVAVWYQYKTATV